MREQSKLFRVFIYLCLILLALSIIIPVVWVFMASIKSNPEFYGNPWAFPKGVYLENFKDAWQAANMGDYFLNSIVVTGLALILLLVIATPCAYILARMNFKGKKFLTILMKAGLTQVNQLRDEYNRLEER